jgi:hypothetical protein
MVLIARLQAENDRLVRMLAESRLTIYRDPASILPINDEIQRIREELRGGGV